MGTEECQSQIPPSDQCFRPPTQVKFINVIHPLLPQLGTELETRNELLWISYSVRASQGTEEEPLAASPLLRSLRTSRLSKC